MVKVVVSVNPLIEHRVIPLDNFAYRTRLHILERIIESDLRKQERRRFDAVLRGYDSKVVVYVNEWGTCYMLGVYLAARGFAIDVVNRQWPRPPRSELATGAGRSACYHCGGLLHARPRRGRRVHGCIVRRDRRGHGSIQGACRPNIAPFLHWHLLHLRAKFRCAEGAPRYINFPDFVQEFVWYLVIECGQRLPRCLVPAAVYTIMDNQASFGLRRLLPNKDAMELVNMNTPGRAESAFIPTIDVRMFLTNQRNNITQAYCMMWWTRGTLNHLSALVGPVWDSDPELHMQTTLFDGPPSRHCLLRSPREQGQRASPDGTAGIDQFSYGVASRASSIAPPARPTTSDTSNIKDQFQGYFEDRRPSSNCDPYNVTAALVRTVCLEGGDSKLSMMYVPTAQPDMAKFKITH